MKPTRPNAGFYFAYSAVPFELRRFPDESARQSWIDGKPESRTATTPTMQVKVIETAKRHHRVDAPDCPLWIPSPDGMGESLYSRDEPHGPGRKPSKNWKGLTDLELLMVRAIALVHEDVDLLAIHFAMDEQTVRVHLRSIYTKIGVRKEDRVHRNGVKWAWGDGCASKGYPPGPGAGLSKYSPEGRMARAVCMDEVRAVARANQARDGKPLDAPGNFVAKLIADREADAAEKIANEARRIERAAAMEIRRAEEREARRLKDAEEKAREAQEAQEAAEALRIDRMVEEFG